MLYLRFSVFALLAASVLSFMPPAPRFARPALTAVYAEKNIIVQADTCLNGECSIDDVNDLLIQLRVQVKNLKSQVGELEKYEQQLTQMNGTPAARDALKDIIKAVLRAMDVDPEDTNFPQLVKAAGFAGEKFGGKGAYDGMPYKKA